MGDAYGPQGTLLIALLAFGIAFLELYYLVTGAETDPLGWFIVPLMLFAGAYYSWRAYTAKEKIARRSR